jgi:hypothetical protein
MTRHPLFRSIFDSTTPFIAIKNEDPQKSGLHGKENWKFFSSKRSKENELLSEGSFVVSKQTESKFVSFAAFLQESMDRKHKSVEKYIHSIG